MSGTLSRHSPRRRGAPRRRPQLFVAFQCERPACRPARLPLEGLNLVDLGRGESLERIDSDSERELRLTVPDERMSSTHARLAYAGGMWVLSDQGSKNGVYVDGHRRERFVLEDGCVFELGHTLFLYRETRAAPEHDPPLLDPALDGPHPSLTTACSSLTADYQQLARIASSQVSVLLRGESGSGKELHARAVHELSGRTGRFVAVNCGSLAVNLVQSELFGYRRGAFSGATEDRPGLVRSAHQGTLFLDEVGDLPAEAQAVLLRVLQEREVLPLGSTDPVAVDVRFVSATHQDLDAMMESGAFRRDLHARLAGFDFRLLPLRERREDLALLVATLLERHGSTDVAFTPEAARAIFHYDWPLNVRELEQCLVSAIALTADGVIDVDELPADVRVAAVPRERAPQAEAQDLSNEDRATRERLLAVAAQHQGNVSAMARELDKDRKQIQRWVKRFGIDLSHYR